MHLSRARWATAVATAALIALPCSALAQPNPPQNPPSQPPSQSQPAAQAPSQTPPSAATSQNGQVDPAAAKQRLTEARDTLSQLTSMPEAAKLQGEARTQVSQLISNFNALITTQSDWRSAYAKVNDSLTTLLGPDSDQNQSGAPAAAAPTGTSGTGAPAATGTAGVSGAPANPSSAPPSAIQLDPAIRAKLVEFRTHLNEFEKAAGGPGVSPAPSVAPSAPSSEPSSAATTASEPTSAASPASASGAMPPAAAPTSTSNPAAPAPAAKPDAAATPEAAAKPETTAKPYAGAKADTAAAEAARSSSQAKSDQNMNAAARSELAAIDAILQKSKTGALTKAQTAELRRHVEALRAVLNQK